MAINLTDEINAATKKGKIASAKQVYLDGDQEDLQQIGDKTHQLEQSIKDISTTGGASTANAVSYNNETSGMTAVNAQSAIDELAAKNKSQDATIATKADASTVNSKNTEQDAEIAKKANKSDMDEALAKKFDKENIAQELGDAEDKVVSQFALPFREIESPEFIKAIVDAEDHFMFGIQLDGSVEWGKGIPAPIRTKLQEIINQSQQDKTDLTEALNAAKEELSNALQEYKTTTDASITALQEGKVDKEEGKSLIDDEVKECFKVIENDEFIKAITDSEGRLLFGIYRETGKPYFPLNDMYHVEQNEEFFAMWLDAENHVLLGIRRDGQIIGEIHACNALKEVVSKLQEDLASLQDKVNEHDDNIKTNTNNITTLQGKVSTLETNLSKFLSVFSLQENPEYLAAETDSDGKVLSATNSDGSHYAYNMKSETIDAKVDKEDNKSLIDSDVADAQSTIEDVEGRTEITTDADNKILSYRDPEGVKHEYSMEVNNLNVSNLNLQGNSVNNIQDALKANGFDVKTPIDWSESSFIQIPEPRFAIINITNIDSMPTTKTQNLHAWMEFWDMQGNYFKKRVILNAQGRSSMAYVKKNASIDICDDEWIGDKTAKVRFGKWVPQDSFHMKAYYTDFVRGLCPICYKLYEEIVNTRGNMYNRPWKKALIDFSKIGTVTKSLGNYYVGDFDLLTDTGARCFPDGFPLACYLNDEFYGIFSFQLKKHRDNYHMDKGIAEHVHLDGTLETETFWSGKDNIDWSLFEIRNPKNLYAIGGNKYDADVKQEEIAGETEINTWIESGKLPDGTAISSKIKKNLQMTAKVKSYIQNLADAVPTIKSAAATYESSDKSSEDLQTFKSVYERYFDVQTMEDYMIMADVIGHGDGFANNWQWITYDGKKWFVCLYDCDLVFGGNWKGNQIYNVGKGHANTSLDKPNGYVVKYYNDEMISRYKTLADAGIISINHFVDSIMDWQYRIGTSFYKQEFSKWKDSPCISDSIVNDEYWTPKKNNSGTLLTDSKETFDATQSYTIGDEVSFGLNSTMGFFKFVCIKQTIAIQSNTPHSVSMYSPIKEFKQADNIYRIQKWIETKIPYMDSLYQYNRV